MKDLFVLTADSDAQALLRSVLRRHEDLRIRQISFDVQRFTGRDSGIVKEGPEIARVLVNKRDYSRLILVWDHHGSGWHERKPEQAVDRIQQRLDGATFAERSAAIVIVPELEEWLWHCPRSIGRLLGFGMEELDPVTEHVAGRLGLPKQRCCREKPKEIFEAILYRQRRRKPLPEDFERLGSLSNLEDWCNSKTFARLVEILRTWFPDSPTVGGPVELCGSSSQAR
jgi:hypothetical protein